MTGTTPHILNLTRAGSHRVQLQYDVPSLTGENRVELPFVVGVIADLSGRTALPSQVADRAFVDVDLNTVDLRIKDIGPRLAFTIQSTLAGNITLPVDLTFERISDFEPAAVIRQIRPLSALV